MAGTSKATHTACCLGMVPKAFVNNELVTQTVPATIDTAGMLAYRANQTAEAKYTSLYMLYKWPTKTVCIPDSVTFLFTLIQSVWEVSCSVS